MDIYTNNTQTRYFITNKFVNQLSSIKVRGLNDGIINYPSLFTLGVLLDKQFLYTDDLGEIKIMESVAGQTESDLIQIPFTKYLRYTDIIYEYMEVYSSVTSRLDTVEEVSKWFKVSQEWDGDTETVTISPSGGGYLEVIIDYYCALIEVRKHL